MKKYILCLLGFCIALSAISQDMTKFNLYKPAEDAEKEIAAATRQAKESGKYVFIQIGGNWCIWCARFHDFITKDPSLDSMVQKNFIVYHLNYSKENYNAKLLAKYSFPQRFGFPVFLILDANGKLLHTQFTGYLEEGKTYSKPKVIEFLQQWSPSALDAVNYKEQ